ncbi:MAG: aldehyde dehydrogenase (NADP(+)) [Acidobacteriaceae bacterium]|nr:aldehyde dehydrogenase (NADP(+)) [Acidobacteriaceae bacterium]
MAGKLKSARDMDIHGKNIIGRERSGAGHETFRSYNPRQGAPSGEIFHAASEEEIKRAGDLAGDAAAKLLNLSAEETAAFLDTVQEEILALGEDLLHKADEESALGLERLRGERDRTVNQIKMFSNLVREGSWVDARIDTPQPDRKPVPKPDVRRMLQPLGAVAVFGASNFPLAFSVAGGDTASAFAARNPVIVKAHPAHPGTSELVGDAIARAVEKRSLPSGTFSMLHGMKPEVSIGLVTNPNVKAVAFTGSQRAGRALYNVAAQRPEPIPVFSEMGSVNPVFLLPSVLANHAEAVAEGVYRSVTLGVGQFCTCPGLMFAVEGEGLQKFEDHLAKQTEQGIPGTMLNAAVAKGFGSEFDKAASVPGVRVTIALRESDPQKTEGRPGVLTTEAQTWIKHQELHEEIFGPATVVVRCGSQAELLECASALEGTLTATLHGTPEEIESSRELLSVLNRKAGRLIANGYPTGVEVGFAMQHGGPYPASTDPRFTSVGAAAIYRFARPLCFQNFPDPALPAELQNANPLRIWRMIDGRLTKDAVPQ